MTRHFHVIRSVQLQFLKEPAWCAVYNDARRYSGAMLGAVRNGGREDGRATPIGLYKRAEPHCGTVIPSVERRISAYPDEGACKASEANA